MKLNNQVINFDSFAKEMEKLRHTKHFDYLVTIVGEDFGGEEGLGCIYILENSDTHERTSVKTLAKRVGENDFVIPSVCGLWKSANLLEREVFDFLGIKFLGHPDMRRLYLRSDFQGYPLRKDFKATDIPLRMTTSPTTVWSTSSMPTASSWRRRTNSLEMTTSW